MSTLPQGYSAGIHSHPPRGYGFLDTKPEEWLTLVANFWSVGQWELGRVLWLHLSHFTPTAFAHAQSFLDALQTSKVPSSWYVFP